MNNRKSIILVFLCLLGLLFALSAQAETVAGKTFKVGTAEEFYALAEKINAEGEAVYRADNSQRIECVNIEITQDMHLPTEVMLTQGANVNIYSTPGKQFTLTAPEYVRGDRPVDILGNPLFDIRGAVRCKISDVIMEGQKNGSFAFRMIGSELTLSNVIIENFLTRAYMSGLMHVGDGNVFIDKGTPQQKKNTFSPKLTMDNVIVRNNETTGSLCLFRMYSRLDDATLTVSNCQFINNKSQNCGAIRAERINVEMENSLFENNISRQYMVTVDGEEKLSGDGGGAVVIQSGSNAKITNTRFINNTSELSGGAVTVFKDSSAVFNGCEFIGNEAATHGGAICVADSFDINSELASKVTLNNCTLTGNKANGNDAGDNFASSPEAAGGGAIFLHEYCEAHLNAGTKLYKNESADEGGAVYVSFGAHLYMDGAQMEENKAATHGGAVYLDGTDAYRGYSHANDRNPVGDDDGYAAGGKFFMTDGLIYRNVAGKNGGGVYIGGENEVEVDGQILRFVGGEMQMTGGVITENQAMDMGGGIFVGSSGNDDIGGTFVMTGGTVHENIAGQDGNTSTGKDDAGAEIFSVGHTSYISVVEADKITAYIRNRSNRFVPESHRSLYYEDWYDDYSDQDPDYGKAVTKVGTGVNTGRYKSSIEPDRIVYTVPHDPDNAYNALILGYKLPGNDGGESPAIPETGDRSMLSLYAALLLVSASAYILMRRREK